MKHIKGGIVWIIIGAIMVTVGPAVLMYYPFGTGKTQGILTILGAVFIIGGIADLVRHPSIIESRERHYVKPSTGSEKYTIKLTHFSWGRGSKVYDGRNSMIFDVNLSARNSMGLLNAFGRGPKRSKSDVVKDRLGMVKYEIYREGLDMFIIKNLSNGEVFKVRNTPSNLRVYDGRNSRVFDFTYGYKFGNRRHQVVNIMGEQLAKVSPKTVRNDADVQISKNQELRDEILISLAILNSVVQGIS